MTDNGGTKKKTVKKIEDLYNVISEDVRKKLAECKTQDDIRRVLAEAGVEPLDDELLDAVAGGYKPFLPCPIAKR